MRQGQSRLGCAEHRRTAEAGHRHRRDEREHLVRNRQPPSQTWRTFLRNHISSLVSVDFCTVPTIRFEVLYVFLVLSHERRRRVHFAVTAHPTAEWAAHQLREAFPWDSTPRYLLRDRDRIFGARTHLALQKDSPEPPDVQPPEAGRIITIPQVGGFHHRYERRAA